MRKGIWLFFVCFVAIVLLSVGCAGFKESGRFQTVKVITTPPGATVQIVSPDTIATLEDSGELVTLPAVVREVKTPTTLIFDKKWESCDLIVRSKGYAEQQVEMKKHFHFNAYLIVLFPFVPFMSDYEVNYFDKEVKVELIAVEGGKKEEASSLDVEKSPAAPEGTEKAEEAKQPETEIEEIEKPDEELFEPRGDE